MRSTANTKRYLAYVKGLTAGDNAEYRKGVVDALRWVTRETEERPVPLAEANGKEPASAAPRRVRAVPKSDQVKGRSVRA